MDRPTHGPAQASSTAHFRWACWPVADFDWGLLENPAHCRTKRVFSQLRLLDPRFGLEGGSESCLLLKREKNKQVKQTISSCVFSRVIFGFVPLVAAVLKAKRARPRPCAMRKASFKEMDSKEPLIYIDSDVRSHSGSCTSRPSTVLFISLHDRDSLSFQPRTMFSAEERL